MYLIDTDILSALRNRERNPEVARWLGGQRTADLYLSVLSVGEIERDLATAKGRDPAPAAPLEDWLNTLLRHHADRILPVDLSVARRCGQLTRQAGPADPNLLIAATALEHGLTVVTRNTRHFQSTGVPVLDPSAPTDAASHTRRQRARRRRFSTGE